MSRFSHDRLEVYQLALQLVVQTERLSAQFDRGWSDLRAQLRRAAASVPLNVAEGAAEWSPREKARFYRIALRSATETVAILDVAFEVGFIDEHDRATVRSMLHSIVGLLIAMSKRFGGETR